MIAQTFAAVVPEMQTVPAGVAFDSLAATYDRDFTDTLIGLAQRKSFWKVLGRTFKTGDSILELNCGTGVDAVFLAKRGVSVFACDASSQMIAAAEQRTDREVSYLPVVFCHLPTERIHQLSPAAPFDGCFSNFSGINCIADLPALAASLSALLKPGAQLILCCSTRYCLLETAYYLLRGQRRKALRRWAGHGTAELGRARFPIYYPTLRELRRRFAPHFKLRAYGGMGVAVPPSYLNAWASRHPILFRLLTTLEPALASLPLLRVTGDHMLLRFEKASR